MSKGARLESCAEKSPDGPWVTRTWTAGWCRRNASTISPMVNLRSAAAATPTAPCSAAGPGCAQSTHSMVAMVGRVTQIFLKPFRTGVPPHGSCSLEAKRAIHSAESLFLPYGVGRRTRFRCLGWELLRRCLGSFAWLGLGLGISILVHLGVRTCKRTKNENRHKPAQESCQQVRYQDGGREEVHFGSRPKQDHQYELGGDPPGGRCHAKQAVPQSPGRQAPHQRAREVNHQTGRHVPEDLEVAEPAVTLEETDHSHDGPRRRAAPPRIGQARCQHIQREQQECLVTGSKWQAGQEPEHR